MKIQVIKNMNTDLPCIMYNKLLYQTVLVTRSGAKKFVTVLANDDGGSVTVGDTYEVGDLNEYEPMPKGLQVIFTN
jgi:hypothetical protein